MNGERVLQKTLEINQDEEVILIRKEVRKVCQELGFSTLEQTRIITACSELARNLIHHGQGGKINISAIEGTDKQGIEVEFIDQGPGIPDVDLAMQEGYSTVGSLGMGLPGARRLVDEMEIDSQPGKGTRVVIRKWKKSF